MVKPRDALGVPALPPARATAAANRLRARLAGLHRSIAPPPVQILEAVFGLLDHAAIVALCELGVPDLLQKPMAVDVLAREAHVDHDRLQRLLRYCASRSWIRFDRRDRVRPTRVTKFLRADHPGGWRAWVTFAGGSDVVGALGQLSVAVRDGVDPFAVANGLAFFEWMSSHPDRSAAFDAAMEAGARMHGLVVAAGLDWSRSHAVCDVAGGTGAFLAVLLQEEPHLQGMVLDLPDVITRARPHERIEFVAGDAFAAVPPGFDTYLFVNVLHDWGDDDAVRLLARAREAADDTARIIVVDADRPRRPVDDLSVQTDLLMLALTPGGRERSTAEFASLASRAGLRLEHSVLLASGDRANVLVPVATSRSVQPRRARADEARAVADVWLRSRYASIPAIPAPVHSDDSMRDWYAREVLPNREVWVVEADEGLMAMMVLKDEWVDALYVDPRRTGHGIGSRLVDLAKERRPGGLDLWAFQSNVRALRFYERHGFVEIETTDGNNEEGAPDVHYRWTGDSRD